MVQAIRRCARVTFRIPLSLSDYFNVEWLVIFGGGAGWRLAPSQPEKSFPGPWNNNRRNQSAMLQLIKYGAEQQFARASIPTFSSGPRALALLASTITQAFNFRI